MTDSSSLLKRTANAPYLLLLFPPLFWAGNAVLARGLAGTVPPITIGFGRWSLALLILIPFGWQQLRQDWPTVRRHLWVMLGLGALGIGLFHSLYYTAAKTTTTINLAVLQTVLPAVVLVLSTLIFREKSTGRQWIGVLLSIIGAVLIISRGNPTTLISNGLVIGDGLMLLAIISYAGYSVVLRFRPEIHPLSLVIYVAIVGWALIFPFYLWERATVGTFQLTFPVAISFVYLAIGPSILAYLCWNRGIELIGPSTAGLFVNLLPIFAAVMAVLFLGETISWYHPVGALLVFAGMVLFTRVSVINDQ